MSPLRARRRSLSRCVALPRLTQSPAALDKAAEKWVQTTFKKMTLEREGRAAARVVVPVELPQHRLATPSQSSPRRCASYHVGGFHVFGASEPAPPVLLNPAYGTVTLGQPLEAASTAEPAAGALGDCRCSTPPTSRPASASASPARPRFRARWRSAPPATSRSRSRPARITGVETRAIGVHVNFAPVVDVNNNPRNPVINTRSFGEDPAQVGRLASAYVRGLQAAGVMATLKHFPGHGDTDVDSHIGLPIIKHPRERLERDRAAAVQGRASPPAPTRS